MRDVQRKIFKKSRAEVTLFRPRFGSLANPIITEPENNVYGPYKVLRRIDNLFVIHDTRPRFPFVFGPVFRHEVNARRRAAELAAVVATDPLTID
jgi:hypothetical protein